ncbi:aldehyde dehydrogenase [Natronospira bacteriovora]|uniref:Aldehyde dehydrogenase n=1 Tax=Natronospira bacteriovora TaxID=3069753 RepID=A0ABU0W480_9GAMM|nr:aldehyde dehydrogenase [Natronospira sp. AB-CW4]MDQ2068777.1 aldehyde dehydrogenase [Natronospira sp. AB-CW4]
MDRIEHYIAGELRSSEAWLENFEPATGQVSGKIADAGEAELDAAIAAAQSAFPAWRRTPGAERARWLNRLADLIERDLEALARAESEDTGKPITLARSVDIPRAASNLRFFAAAATQFSSESHLMEDGAINWTLREPHGVVACISPWNLPLYLFTWKIAPALAAGNCVIGKPSEVTPKTAWLFSKLCIEAGLPSGVLNILHGRGPGIGARLIDHPAIKAISFTGGTATGAEIARVAAPRFKKLSLELGGKNPTIVFEDCDWEHTLEETLRAAFANQGQICLCGSRLLIQADIYEAFRDAFVEKARALNPADPALPETRQGAVVSRAHYEKVLGCIEQAREDGAHILVGGEAAQVGGRCDQGWFIQPTVIEGLSPSCRSNQQEIFGPVVSLMPFRDEEEALAIANGVDYGLASSIWTKDISRAHRMARNIESGLVWINCWMRRDLRVPMGGMKQSGVGREGGWEAMRFFTEAKNVTVAFDG